jgi:FMN phosphatase YigB (HAD superfamily)
MRLSSQALDDAFALIATIDICSFDIFDTFLLRRCATPEGVYEQACHLLSVRHGRDLAVEAFVQHRIQAEAKARRQAAEARGSIEITIEDVYSLFPLRLFGFGRDQIADLAQAEFDAELALCYVNPDVSYLYDSMRHVGRSTGFISDTYWGGERIRQLLLACRPGLCWDFLLASSDHGTGKAGKLFAIYMSEQDVQGRAALHIGDNKAADINGAKKFGIRAIYYPQASSSLHRTFQAEDFAFNLLRTQPQHSKRLDAGIKTMRRAVAKHTSDPPHDTDLGSGRELGHRVLGPIMAGFDHFIAQRAERLKSDDRNNVKVAFLGRDGMLPYRVWTQQRDDTGYYLEINRRVTLVASADNLEPLCDLFKTIPRLDAKAVKAILKSRAAWIDDFFKTRPDGIVSGVAFSRALPGLMKPTEVQALGGQMRRSLIGYLESTIANFADCTDLILVDLGYSGTVQKALRRTFDIAGIKTRLHGAYLLTLDDATCAIPDTDSAEGFISDLVITPHAKRAILANVSLLEQFCASPDGSVGYYRDGVAVREADSRPQEQLRLCADIQTGALEFADCLKAIAPRHRSDPFADPNTAPAWCAAILARLLFLPHPDEVSLFSAMKHDVNLGTQAIAPLLGPEQIRNLELARGIGGAFTGASVPMWPAASLTQQSPHLGIFYAMYGTGLLPSTMIADRKAGVLDVALITGATANAVKVPYSETVFGRIRIQIPVAAAMAVSTVAIPIGQIAAQGRMTGAVVQTGPSITAAMRSEAVTAMSPDKLSWIAVERDDAVFSIADPETAYLAIAVPAIEDGALVITLEFDVYRHQADRLSSDHSERTAAA